MALHIAYNPGMAIRQHLSDQLRQAVLKCGKTRYRIGVETRIAHSIISRFINHGAGMSLANVDKLCECIGAELVLKAGARSRKHGAEAIRCDISRKPKRQQRKP
jgi:hypothetical protein